MSKRIKLFEQFINEAATATVTVQKDIKISKSIEEKIKLAQSMTEELDKLQKEYAAKMKPMISTIEKYDEELLEAFKKVGASTVKVQGVLDNEEIIAQLITTKGKTTYSYKTLWEEALKKFNEATKKVLLEMQDANKNIGKDKEHIEYMKSIIDGKIENGKLKESIASTAKEAVDWIKGWVKKSLSKLKSLWEDYSDSADDLVKLGAELK